MVGRTGQCVCTEVAACGQSSGQPLPFSLSVTKSSALLEWLQPPDSGVERLPWPLSLTVSSDAPSGTAAQGAAECFRFEGLESQLCHLGKLLTLPKA